MQQYEKKRILIWGKTYPELSSKYTETVCTGGVLEDGRPIRLYPIPFRYLEGDQKFSIYQWITADVVKDKRDPRPESYRVEAGSIVCEDVVPTSSDEWGKRAEYIMKHSGWLFNSVEDLKEKERVDGTSLGVVEPRQILSVSVKRRTEDERTAFDGKLEDLTVMNEAQRAQIQMFDDFTVPELKTLGWIESRFEIHWYCQGKECTGHHTQALDWGLIELQRRQGIEAAQKKLEEICDLDSYALKFFMGNIKSHPTAFTVVGLWYPKRSSTPLLF